MKKMWSSVNNYGKRLHEIHKNFFFIFCPIIPLFFLFFLNFVNILYMDIFGTASLLFIKRIVEKKPILLTFSPQGILYDKLAHFRPGSPEKIVNFCHKLRDTQPSEPSSGSNTRLKSIFWETQSAESSGGSNTQLKVINWETHSLQRHLAEVTRY